MLDPIPPPYDIRAWRQEPFHERMRQVCVAWATQGYGIPNGIYLVYVLKILFLYVGGWVFFCRFSPGAGSLGSIGTWAFTAVAFQKAALWTLAYEGLGFGCASGPLTGRYVPPIGGFLYFLRPGTTKLSVVPEWPVLGGTRRTPLDAGLYALHYVFLFRALTAPAITPALLMPTVVLLPILGLADKTIFLASRAEHHFSTLVCVALAGAGTGPGGADGPWLAGCKVVWLSIWWWAATSKVNLHFPTVISVMMSNSPWMPVAFRKAVFRHYPDDLRNAPVTTVLAHFGTATEYLFPLLLITSDGGPLTVVALVVMLGFHSFITSNMPMGVPVEWNVIMVYGGFFLFGTHADVGLAGLADTPLLASYLAVMHVGVPLYGNLVPSKVSFLLAMRYYAGNWAYSIWLFKKGTAEKLNRLVKWSPTIRQQLESFMDDPDAVDEVMSRVPAFRLMHLHGRVLHDLIPKAVDDVEGYEWIEGEVVAGIALGWNFGDGHLHDERLLDAIQEQCGFAEGELRCIMVEGQPLGGRHHAWRIVDAATGSLEVGRTRVADLVERQPWPPPFERPSGDAG